MSIVFDAVVINYWRETMSEYELFLQTLAEKLGTTVESLWMVMVGQAPISATVDLFIIALWAASVFWGFGFVHMKTTEVKEGKHYPEWDGDGKFFAWLLWALSALLVLAFVASSAEEIVAGYFNPEYWALMKLKG